MEVPKFEGVTFDAFLTYNGSYCFTPERDVFKNLIPKADIALLRRERRSVGAAHGVGHQGPAGR